MYKLRLYLQNPISVASKLFYFITHPAVLIKNRLTIHFLNKQKNINSNYDIQSDLPIDIVFPTIAKDFEVVSPMIDSVRQHVKHPIGSVFIISPPTDEIKRLCKEKNCVFVDENKLLPITVKDIRYVHKGKNRSGWLFQQLLKWGANELGNNKHFLVTESDTVFIRPRVFENSGKYIIPCSNELPHIPYFKMYEKLLGERIKPILNMTAHHGLYDKEVLQDLKNRIEKKWGKVWYQAIIDNINYSDGSCVSDYETYLQYLHKHYPEKVELEHWGNVSLPRAKVKELNTLAQQLRNSHKVISFHSYNT